MNKIVNIVSSPIGGGAELLVRELHKYFIMHDIESSVIYLSGSATKMEDGEVTLGKNPRNPLNIFRLRKILRKLPHDNGKLIVHAHLTWPFLYVALASFNLQRISLIYTEHSTTNRRRNVPMLW